MFGKASGRKGKSPSKGKQQKGQHKGQQKGPWANPEPAGSWWGGWQEPEAATGEAAPSAEGGFVRRILARDCVVKKILRPYAAADGRVLYGENGDEELLGKASLRAILTAEVSELSRRPCWGISMAGKSVAKLFEALNGTAAQEAREQLRDLLASSGGRKYVTAMGDVDYDTHKFDPDVLKANFVDILEFNKEEKTKLHALLPKVACAAAQEYVGAIQALDVLVKANALGAWSENVPDEEHVQPYLDKFRSGKPTPEKAATFLVGAYKARKKLEAAWKRAGPGAVWGDDSEEEGPRTRRKRKAASSAAGSEESQAKKKKKAKEDKKTKRKKTSSSSPTSKSEDNKKKKESKKDKKEKKRKPSSSEEPEKVESEETQVEKKNKKGKKEKKDKKDNKDKEDKNEKKQRRSSSLPDTAREAQEAAFTAWTQADLEVYLADVENQVTNMAGRAGARFEVKNVQEFAERIPAAVRPYGPTIPEVDGDYMDAKEALSLLKDMLRLARDAEAFLTSGTRATAVGSEGK